MIELYATRLEYPHDGRRKLTLETNDEELCKILADNNGAHYLTNQHLKIIILKTK